MNFDRKLKLTYECYRSGSGDEKWCSQSGRIGVTSSDSWSPSSTVSVLGPDQRETELPTVPKHQSTSR